MKTRNPSIGIPNRIDDALKTFLLLQSLFKGSDMNNHNILCISTKRNLYELTVRDGWITFYKPDGHSKDVSLMGASIKAAITRFFDEIKNADHCKITAVEREAGNHNTDEFEFTLKHKGGSIVIINDRSENFRPSYGGSGDM